MLTDVRGDIHRDEQYMSDLFSSDRSFSWTFFVVLSFYVLIAFTLCFSFTVLYHK